jgi:plasmid stabilization system protein ParE
VRVEWTDSALENLWAIHEYISQSSPEYAQRIVDRITRRTRQIASFPLSGRVVPEFSAGQIRELIEGPYRIIYYIKPDQIDVLAVIHGAQRAPWEIDVEN